ncbi:MAG: FAD-dependent oxidoreductase [Clostridia bacterium]|nr:FAD-dependent oxidoreductase [Clostridia bacterium]
MKNYDLVVVGGGPAGMAAAVAAFDAGVKNILIIERDTKLGGVLNQCVHNGFGLTRFKENLAGPEYAEKFSDEVEKRDIDVMLSTMVLEVGADKTVTAMNSEYGVFTLKPMAIILAMGCRERSKGALNIAGARSAGIYSAGTAQRYVNIEGYLPGKNVVILGSGDIGLIMARRMTLEGAKVHAVCEIMPFSSGLKRNIVQCLDDFGIPLYLNHTIVDIQGKERVTGVTIAEVNPVDKKPIKGTEIHFDCDTVLFSVGLIPENELTKNAGIPMSPRTKGAIVNQYRETDVEGIFACGNVLHVHDLVDFASEEAEIAGRSAYEYISGKLNKEKTVNLINGANIGYVLPQKITVPSGDVKVFFRVTNVFKNVTFKVKDGDEVVISKKKLTVAPGEMETIVLKSDLLSANKSGNITIELEAQND